MIHFSFSKFNILYVFLAPRAEPEGIFCGWGTKKREYHNTMKNTAQEGARGRAGRNSPPPQQPLDKLKTCVLMVKGKIAVKWRARAFRHGAGPPAR